MPDRRCRVIASLVLVAGACIASAGGALAQGGGERNGGRGGFGGSQYRAADIPMLVQAVGLDEVQQDIVRVLFDEHEAAIREAFASMREQAEAMEDDRGSRQQLSLLREEATAKQRRLDARMEADLRAILYAEQLDRWPIFERDMRRERTLADGELAGEDVNVFLVVRDEEIDVPAVPGLAEALEQYAVELDPVLVFRNDLLETSGPQMREAMEARDLDKAASIAARQMRARADVRDVNLRHADAVAGLLDDEQAASFREAVRREAYARVYSPSATERAFEAARDIDALSPDVLAAIESLEAAYLAELLPMQEQIVQAIQIHETRQEVERARMSLERQLRERTRGGDRGPRPPQPDDPIRDAYERKSDLDARYRQSLEAMLTPDQIDLLPSDRRWRGRGDD